MRLQGFREGDSSQTWAGSGRVPLVPLPRCILGIGPTDLSGYPAFALLQVSHVLAALQAGNRGTQACITAASAVSGIIADLDTTIMFATAGTLNRENAETFADHRLWLPWAGGWVRLFGANASASSVL